MIKIKIKMIKKKSKTRGCALDRVQTHAGHSIALTETVQTSVLLPDTSGIDIVVSCSFVADTGYNVD